MRRFLVVVLFASVGALRPLPASVRAVRTRLSQHKEDGAEDLLRRARGLREEVAAEEDALRVARGVPAAPPAVVARIKLRMVLPIASPDWSIEEKECDFEPALEEDSELVRFDVPLPCGMILEETEEDELVVVGAVGEGSNAQTAGLRRGDVLRAVSAVRAQMEMPTWQILAGGIGRPKFFRFIFGADLAGPPRRTFEDVLAAVSSNRDDAERRPAIIVVERATRELPPSEAE